MATPVALARIQAFTSVHAGHCTWTMGAKPPRNVNLQRYLVCNNLALLGGLGDVREEVDSVQHFSTCCLRTAFHLGEFYPGCRVMSVQQETTAEELESAFRSEVWHPFKGRLLQHGGLRAARVDLNSLTNEAKVPVSPNWSLGALDMTVGPFRSRIPRALDPAASDSK